MFGAQRRAGQRAVIRRELFALITSAPRGLTVPIEEGGIAASLAQSLHRVMNLEVESATPYLRALGLDELDESLREERLNALLVEVVAIAPHKRIRVLRRVLNTAFNRNELGHVTNPTRKHMSSVNVMTPEQADNLGYRRSF